MNRKEVFIVEDEPDIARLLKDYLEHDGFSVNVFTDGLDVVDRVRLDFPDFLILDLMLPKKDGLTICREVRQFSNLPIMMVTAKIEEIDRIVGLEVGADDYVCKPFSPREVVRRVHTILRRVEAPPQAVNTHVINYRGVELDSERLSCIVEGEPIELTRVEFQILYTLISKCGVVFSREKLMNLAYTDDRVVSNRTIDTHVKNLRKKLLVKLGDRELIYSIYGAGYKAE